MKKLFSMIMVLVLLLSGNAYAESTNQRLDKIEKSSSITCRTNLNINSYYKFSKLEVCERVFHQPCAMNCAFNHK